MYSDKIGKSIFIFLVFIIHLTGSVFSQNNYSAKATQVQIEAMGSGSLFSINIDSRFAKKEKGLGFRVGIGGSPLGLLGKSCNSGVMITLPVALNYLIGKKQHLLELGAGGTLSLINSTKKMCLNFEPGFFSDQTCSYTFLSAGYRYQPLRQRGMTYRVFISPLFQKDFSPKFWGGASIGYRW